MSKKRYFDTRFWTDSWVVDHLNPLDQHLFLYLLLNDHTSFCGIYELPLRSIANDTGLDREQITKMMKRLEPKVFYKEGWVVIVNSLKYQNYKNSKIAVAIQKEMCKVPAHLMELINIPTDFDMDFACPINDSLMTHEESSTLNVIKLNVIKSNAPKVAGVSKKPKKSQYAKAVKADEELNRKALQANTRAGDGYGSFAKVGEELKKRKLK